MSLEKKLFEGENLTRSEHYLWNEISISLRAASKTKNCEPTFFPYGGIEPASCFRVIIAGEPAGFCAYKFLFRSTRIRGLSRLVFNCEKGAAIIAHSWRNGSTCTASTVPTTTRIADIGEIHTAIRGFNGSTATYSSIANKLPGKTSRESSTSLPRRIKWTNRIYFADGTSTSKSLEESANDSDLDSHSDSDFADEDLTYVDLQNMYCSNLGSFSLCTQYVSFQACVSSGA